MAIRFYDRLCKAGLFSPNNTAVCDYELCYYSVSASLYVSVLLCPLHSMTFCFTSHSAGTWWNLTQTDENTSLSFAGVVSVVEVNHLLKTQSEHFSFSLSNEALNGSSIKTFKLDHINH